MAPLPARSAGLQFTGFGVDGGHRRLRPIQDDDLAVGPSADSGAAVTESHPYEAIDVVLLREIVVVHEDSSIGRADDEGSPAVVRAIAVGWSGFEVARADPSVGIDDDERTRARADEPAVVAGGRGGEARDRDRLRRGRQRPGVVSEDLVAVG